MWVALLVASLLLIHLQHGAMTFAAVKALDHTGFCSEIIQPLSIYDCALYTVSTQDGFNLALHKVRMKGGLINGTSLSTRDAVLFLHSAVMGGDMWFASPSPTPLYLAGKGYTVWIAHFRTSLYSLGHVKFNPDEQEYWDWCNDELSNYDFPAFLDTVYELNDNKSLHVVGYSQGASVTIGAMSYQRETRERLKSVVLLAPVLYMRHVISPLLRVIGASDFGMAGYNAGLGKFSFSLFSRDSEGGELASKLAITAVTGPNCCVNTRSAFTLITNPSSHTTYKCIAHLTQCIKLGNYQAFDHQNQTANQGVYGSVIPPSYSFHNVPESIPILVVHGGKDQLTSPKDVKHFMQHLPTPPSRHFLANYAHLDIIFGKRVEEDINKRILNFIEQHQ